MFVFHECLFRRKCFSAKYPHPKEVVNANKMIHWGLVWKKIFPCVSAIFPLTSGCSIVASHLQNLMSSDKASPSLQDHLEQGWRHYCTQLLPVINNIRNKNINYNKIILPSNTSPRVWADTCSLSPGCCSQLMLPEPIKLDPKDRDGFVCPANPGETAKMLLEALWESASIPDLPDMLLPLPESTLTVLMALALIPFFGLP